MLLRHTVSVSLLVILNVLLVSGLLLTVAVKVFLMCLSCLERAKVVNGLSVELWLLGVNPLSGMSAMRPQPASVSHQ